MPIDDNYLPPRDAWVGLDLESALLEREVEAKIKLELGRLPVARRESVLARIVVDVLDALPDAIDGSYLGS